MANVDAHYYIGAVALAVRLYNAMPAVEREEFDEAQGHPMVRLSADFNGRNFTLAMAPNGKRWMLRDREPADGTKDPER